LLQLPPCLGSLHRCRDSAQPDGVLARPFHGMIDEIRIWNKVRLPSRVSLRLAFVQPACGVGLLVTGAWLCPWLGGADC
jgi:hypothetical protein